MVKRRLAIACQSWFVAVLHDEFLPFMVIVS